MNIQAQHPAALQMLGYDDQEAQFLYLVATHSGYFTIQQFFDFNTKRYFVDRFPTFIPNPENGLDLQPVVTFTYCDTVTPSLAQYVTHPRAYGRFLRRLPAFNFVYASPNPAKFIRVRALFARLFVESGTIDARHLLRHFQFGLLWARKRTSMFSRADRDFLRAGDHHYRGEPFETAFRNWAAGDLSDSESTNLLGPPKPSQEGTSYTHALPHGHNIFETFSGLIQRNVTPRAPFRSRSVLVPPSVSPLGGEAATYVPRAFRECRARRHPVALACRVTEMQAKQLAHWRIVLRKIQCH
jgi:hypothetical protein